MEIAAIVIVTVLAVFATKITMQTEIDHLNNLVKWQSGEIGMLRGGLKNTLLDAEGLRCNLDEKLESESELREILGIGDSDSIVDTVRNLKFRCEMTSEAFMRQELAGHEAISRKLQNED